MSVNAKKSLFVAIVLAAGFFGGLVVSGRMSLTSTSDATVEPPQTRSAAAPALGGLPDMSAVAERAVKASVNISSTQMRQVNPFFQMMYGGGDAVPQTSLGSGVFVSTDGFILTNSHVVQSPDADIKVTLSDDREFDAKVIGVDPVTDLAVLKVDVRDAAPLPWGNSANLKIAEWVLAVGNPFAFNQTVTLGIVSAVNRHDPQLATYNDFIQTDAAINPGNSGGALVNSRGELVGINTMIYSQTGGYQGLGFAVPANLARGIMEELKTNREIVRGSIGLAELRTMDAAVAQRTGLRAVPGVVILNMWRNEPAHRSGLRPGDIITAFNGKPVKEESELERLIAASPVNSTVRVEVIRDGGRRTFEVPVMKMPTRRRM